MQKKDMQLEAKRIQEEIEPNLIERRVAVI